MMVAPLVILSSLARINRTRLHTVLSGSGPALSSLQSPDRGEER